MPKKELVSSLQARLQSRRLKISPALPEAAVLAEEWMNFKPKQLLARSEDMADWREAPHDDLVFAVAIAVWQ